MIVRMMRYAAIGALLGAGVLTPGFVAAQKPKSLAPSSSTTIALFRQDKRVLVVNRETNSLSIIEVRGRTGDLRRKVAEIGVGLEPRCVALGRKEREAFVTNTVSGTVSVVALTGPLANTVITDIPVGTEPRGCAVTPNRKTLFVANHTDGTVSVIDTKNKTVIDTVQLGGNPTAIAVTNDGDKSDDDETVFVTQFYAEPIPNGPGEGFDDGRQGVLHAFTAAAPRTPTRVTLSPLANVGFTGDRKQFCQQFMMAGAMMNAASHSNLFCPDINETDPTAAVIAMDPQGAFPNQLASIVTRGNRVFIPNIGAGPEPPVRFNVNVQALVHVVNRDPLAENTAAHVNLNDQIADETQPANPTESLDRIFGNDLVAIDGTRDGSTFLIVSRGGNVVLRASADANGVLSLGAPDVVRFQVGNLPNGVVITRDGTRAYVNNEANVSISALDLQTNTVLTRDIPSGTPPAPGTFAHAVLVGKLAFFTALGIPSDGIFGTPIRDFVPLEDRGKASDNGWSGCGSCHPEGLADGVTWIFGTGPRQTVPLDAFFAKDNPIDQRISNYSAVMGSITDFNGNSRNVQGGTGFAANAADVFQHGPTQGVSDAHDAMTLWVQTVRAPILPVPSDTASITAGRTVFGAECASCHGGAKWSKSQTVYLNNPTFPSNPAVAGTLPFDPGLVNAGPQIVSYTIGLNTLAFLDPVGTFDVMNDLEIRSDGTTALGGIGFNSPSLLGIRYHAPYLHDGSATVLDDVFAAHELGAGTIASELSPAQLDDLEVFLNSIDGRTVPFESDADAFLDALTTP
jgi:YVTN family beta-propeller protein